MADSSKRKEAILLYRALERRVRFLVEKECSPGCSGCETCCCRPEICAEAETSLWLRWVRSFDLQRGQPRSLDGQDGWLSREKGCRLATGRPPVCHGYFCDRVETALEGPRRHYTVKVSGRIMTYCGERALGQRHLVELSRDELERVNYERVVRRLVKATKLQEACEALRAGRALDDADFHELERAVRSVRLRSIVKWHGVTEVTV